MKLTMALILLTLAGSVINVYFSKDARIFLPNSEVVTGSAAIAELNAEYVTCGISEFREKTTAVTP